MPTSRSDSALSSAGASARGVSDSPRNPARDSSPSAKSAMASSSSATSLVCCALSRRRATAITRSPSAASWRTMSSISGPTSWQAASTTSGAPLTVSSSSDTDAENDLPDRNGRWASASVASAARAVGSIDRQRRLDDGPVGGVHLRAAVGVRRGVRRKAQYVVAGVTGDGMHLRHPQPVLRQRSGLVEADDVDAAERLDRTGDAHQRAVLGQPSGRRGLGERRHQRHALGDRGHGDRDSAGHRFAQPAAAQQAQRADQRTAGRADRECLVGQLAELVLQPDRRAVRRMRVRRRGAPGCRRRRRSPARPRCPRRSWCRRTACSDVRPVRRPAWRRPAFPPAATHRSASIRRPRGRLLRSAGRRRGSPRGCGPRSRRRAAVARRRPRCTPACRRDRSTTLRAGGTCCASSSFSRLSARSRWLAASTEFPVSTEPTRTASTGEPNIALAAEPSASTGVSGSDNSACTALTNCQTARRGRPVSSAPRWAVSIARVASGLRRDVGLFLGFRRRQHLADLLDRHCVPFVDRGRQRSRCVDHPAGH